MNTLWFLAMLIGIGWLMVWSVLPKPYRGLGWWPFDMRQDSVAGEAAAEASEGAAPGRVGHATRSSGGRAAPAQPAPWRDRVGRGSASPPRAPASPARPPAGMGWRKDTQ